MKKAEIILWIGIIILLLIIPVFFFSVLQTEFITPVEVLNQYDVNPDAYLTTQTTREVWGYFRGGQIGMTLADVYPESPLVSSNVADNVEINTGKNVFKFITFENKIFERDACYETVKVYKNNVFIDEIVLSDIGDREKTYYDDDILKDSYAKIYLQYTKYYLFGVNKCLFIHNQYSLKVSENDFIINISTPTKTYIEGEKIIINTDIDNKLNSDVKAKVDLKFSIPSILGDISKVESKELILKPGVNNLIYEFVATGDTERLEITPTLEISFKGDNFKNLNYGEPTLQHTPDRILGSCTSQQGCNIYTSKARPMIDSQAYIPVGILKLNSQIISIFPRPLYIEKLNKECVEGYVSYFNESYCIRDDIKELSCVILGCPVVNNIAYECTSAGICAQTVFQLKDCKYDEESFNKLNDSAKLNINLREICSTDSTCDIDSGLCVKSEIFKEIIQCKMKEDCLTLCEGRRADCVNNKCVYSGECKNIQYPTRETKTKNVTILIIISILIILFIVFIYLFIRQMRKTKRT